MIDQNTRFLIVGLGLIGGSYAMGLKKKGYHVDAIDIQEESISYALQNNLIDHGSTYDTALIQQADIIISALYPKAMVTWIKNNQKHMKPYTFISDVSGVKSGIVEEIQNFLRDDLHFCASHPMAGKEVSGVQNADDTIFHSANFIITPTAKNTQQDISCLKDLAHILEFSHISILTLEEHDTMIGFLSQLTHVIAVSLMNTNDNTHLVDYTGDSFRDLTRIAKINENMWSELFFLNKDILIQEIDSFMKEVENLKTKLVEHDEEGLKTLFRQSTKRRKLFDR
mgnify:FL=1